MGVSYSNVRTV